ncbi:MAG: acyl-CoA thioesterase [Proteobacteria bacterium]|nr:acyl-CoA thioesterase [Pseudomonadota bacterium]
MSRPQPLKLADFRYVTDITTRWMDNDVYGHINNVTYYSFFDTVVANFLIESGVLDIATSPVVGLVVDTQCSYFASIAYPDKVRAGLRVAHVGISSVRYEIGIFRNDDTTAAAQGHFVHVYVNRATNKPVPLSDKHKKALAGLKPL